MKHLRIGTLTEIRQEAIRRLGGRCNECGFDDIRALQIDHVSGGGQRAHGEKNVYQTYKNAVVDDGRKYQVLCANCNWIKRFKRGEHRGYNNDEDEFDPQMPLFEA